MPTADDLFRPTAGPESAPAPEPGEQHAADAPAPEERHTAAPAPEVDEGAARPVRKPSGRIRHDEKMTVYVTADELLDLEHARLSLRREHGLAVDRGRLVRAAIAIALAELDADGDDSQLVQHLKQG